MSKKNTITNITKQTKQPDSQNKHSPNAIMYKTTFINGKSESKKQIIYHDSLMGPSSKDGNLKQKENFGATQICPIDQVCFDIPSFDEFMSKLGITKMFDDLGQEFKKMGDSIASAVDFSIFDKIIADITSWNPIEDLEKAFAGFDLMEIILELLMAFMAPAIEVARQCMIIFIDILEPIIRTILPASSWRMFYYFTIPILLFICTSLNMFDVTLGLMNQLSGAAL